MLLHVFDAATLGIDVIRQYTKNPDMYSGGITNSAYVIMRRPFAPAVERLASLVERETQMPGRLAQARENLQNPPRIYTEIALEQIDGNISFFKSDVPAAFKEVTDAALKASFKRSNDGVIAALIDYKTFLRNDLLPKSTGWDAFGEETYHKALAANEMIDLPTSRLLEIAEKDRQANETAFQETAKKINSSKGADAVLALLQQDHPAPSALLKTTQDTLDSLRQFMVDHHIVTIPSSEPAQVKETPPFMRSTTSASMETPGPFEKAQLKGFYNMTLPDPRWKPAQQADFMRQWDRASIANVSVHEVYPGHYLQFLYAKQFPSDVRKVYRGDKCRRLGALLRADDARRGLSRGRSALSPRPAPGRAAAGHPLHRRHQDAHAGHDRRAGHGALRVAGTPAPSRRSFGSETRHGGRAVRLLHDGKTDDPEVAVRLQSQDGALDSLQGFHDAFIKLGPLPLPLIRKALLGETGDIF